MRNVLYQWVIGDATDCCYSSCLDYFYEKAVILDVGIGNGVMVKDHHREIKEKQLKIVGIDIDHTYIEHCRELVDNYDLTGQIQVFETPVEKFQPNGCGSFDFILFSMSFMLIDDQERVLERVSEWLKPGGKILFFQTMFKSRNRLIEEIKPRLKHLTTVEFGEVTYDRDFYDLLGRLDFKVDMDRCIKKTWYNGTYRLIAARPNSNGSGSERLGWNYQDHFSAASCGRK
ncbi:MAG TPA: class I SAM-dependent methyltransferase [Desulfobacteraceae bacterium]|nr:class I SAM-dependent methyltransferase [Desulfobacteraceae bacterium]